MKRVLYETAHMGAFEAATYTENELMEALKAASEDLISFGITSVHDAGGYGADNLRMMQQTVRSGDVKVRIYAMICALNRSEEFVEAFLGAGVVTGLGDERFRIGYRVTTQGSAFL